MSISLKEVISQPAKEMKLKTKNVYGNELIYPDCELSQFATGLTQKKTFDKADITNLKKLGFNVKLNGVNI